MTYIYQQMNECDFHDAFLESDGYRNNFSYYGRKALYNYLIEYAESTGEAIELDIVALCCEYSEYENMTEFKKDYPNILTRSEIQDRTQYIPVTDSSGKEASGFIIQQF